MAKTLEELIQEYQAKVSSDPVLNSLLTSNSDSSVHRVFASILAQLSVVINNENLSVIQTASDTVTKQRVHNKNWMENVSKEFQYGDELTVINSPSDLFIGQYTTTYETIDESKRIISFASASDETGQVFLKVAKLSSGMPVKLEEEELNSFIKFVDEIIYMPNFSRKPAALGGASNVISIDGDTIDISFIAELDPTVFVVGSSTTANNGLNIQTQVKDVEVAIENLLKTPNDFGGKVYLSRIIDTVMSIDGVNNFVVTAATGLGYTKPIEDILSDPRREYETESGYVANVDFTTVVYE